MANFYINAETFSGATSIYMDISLSTLAPDGYYSFDETYRQQVGGVLLSATNICVSNVIIANNDSYSAIVTQGINGYNILANDTLGSSAATTSNVIITQVSTSNPSVNINTATGAVVVASGTPVGSYAVVYKICEAGKPTNCDTANVTITINALPNYLCMNYGPDCASACTTNTGTFSYFANKMAGSGEPAPTAGCTAITTIPVYTAEEITEITTGMTIYSDSALTTEFAGDSKWYGIGANDNGPSYGKFQVNNSGTLVVKQTCPDYCCGEVILYPSNFTNEDANYFLENCETGVIYGVTVPYGSQPVTEYCRIPCGLNPFNMTRVRSTGAELCNENALAYVLYAQTNVLTVGNYLFEDSSGLYTFQHGNIYIKEITTERIWQVNQYGKIIGEYTSCP